MKLYNYFRSSAAYRVRIALALKDVPYELRLGAPDQRRRPPQAAGIPGGQSADARAGTRPFGGETLIQSMAIMEYLDEVVSRAAAPAG